MDDKEEILKLLAKTPGMVDDIARGTGLRREWLASLLMKMEKEKLIVWDKGVWRIPQSPGAEDQGTKP